MASSSIEKFIILCFIHLIIYIYVLEWNIILSDFTDNFPEYARNGKLWYLIKNSSLIVQETNVHTYYMDQLVDHYNPQNRDIFKQKYYVDDIYWTDVSGPILLYIGGEGTLSGLPNGFIRQIAKQHRAKIVGLEHRFYGESIPFDDMSVKNLKYLTIEQALADLAYFREIYQSYLPVKTNKWFSIGGSYPGALSAWFRISYPKATIGGLASSAVVHSIYNFTGFDEQVSQSVGEECAYVLRKVTKEFEIGFKNGQRKELKESFGASNLSDEDFFYMLADAGAMAVQYSHKDKLCQPMIHAYQNNQSLTQAYQNFTYIYYGSKFGSACFYDTQCLKSLDIKNANARSWRWQKCTQVAFFQVAPPKKSIRSSLITLEYHEKQCSEVFGSENIDPLGGSNALNERFGGEKPYGKNIFFSNGGDDPWQRASVLTSLSFSEPAYVAQCDFCGHCGDISSRIERDNNGNILPEPLIHLRELIKKYFQLWLDQANMPFSSIQLEEKSEDSLPNKPSVIKEILFVFFPLLVIGQLLKLILRVDSVRTFVSAENIR